MDKFDLVTHKRNSKGKIVSVDPYRLHVKNDMWKFERPPGSGNMYAANGELIEGPLFDEKMKAVAQAKQEREALKQLVQDKVEKQEAKPEPSVNKFKPVTSKVEVSNGRAAEKVSKD
jgi:hypothetical protein